MSPPPPPVRTSGDDYGSGVAVVVEVADAVVELRESIAYYW